MWELRSFPGGGCGIPALVPSQGRRSSSPRPSALATTCSIARAFSLEMTMVRLRIVAPPPACPCAPCARGGSQAAAAWPAHRRAAAMAACAVACRECWAGAPAGARRPCVARAGTAHVTARRRRADPSCCSSSATTATPALGWRLAVPARRLPATRMWRSPTSGGSRGGAALKRHNRTSPRATVATPVATQGWSGRPPSRRLRPVWRPPLWPGVARRRSSPELAGV